MALHPGRGLAPLLHRTHHESTYSPNCQKIISAFAVPANLARRLSAVLFLVAGYVCADTHTLDTTVTTDSHAANLRVALDRWSSKLAATGGRSPTAYDFALADKRLAIPDCSDFVIDPMNRIPSNTAPASLVVDVQCPDKNWQRRIRGQRDTPSTTPGAVAKPTVQVFTLHAQ